MTNREKLEISGKNPRCYVGWMDLYYACIDTITVIPHLEYCEGKDLLHCLDKLKKTIANIDNWLELEVNENK